MKGLFISMVLFAIGMTLCSLYAFIYNMKLYFYLKKEKYDRWCELTTIGNFGPGGSNPFRGFPYIYSDQDSEDIIIRKYKDSIKLGFRQSLFILIALLVNATILAVLIVMSK
jgi:hypothetical protein